MQLLLSLPMPDEKYLLIHKLKLALLFVNLPLQLNILYHFFFPDGKRIIPKIFALVSFLLLLALFPTDFIISYPINSIEFDISISSFIYHFGKTNLGYSIYSIVVILSFIASLVHYFVSDSDVKRIPFVVVLFSTIIVSSNDFLVAHGIIQSLMLGEYYIFLFVAFIFIELLLEDKRIYITMLEFNEKLKDLEKSKSYFLGLLSHELNTPLMGVNGNARLIMDMTEDEDIIECSEQILLSEARLRKFSDLSLLIMKMKTDKIDIFYDEYEIVDVIDMAIGSQSELASSKNIEITKEYNTSNHVFNLDIGLMTRVFEIILNNAIKYSPEKSKVIISTRKQDNKYLLEIQDQGQGFTEKSFANLYKFFESTEDLMSHSEGTGLSLAAAKLIVETHGFKISVKNAPINGTIVRISFPILEYDYRKLRIKKIK